MKWIGIVFQIGGRMRSKRWHRHWQWEAKVLLLHIEHTLRIHWHWFAQWIRWIIVVVIIHKRCWIRRNRWRRWLMLLLMMMHLMKSWWWWTNLTGSTTTTTTITTTITISVTISIIRWCFHHCSSRLLLVVWWTRWCWFHCQIGCRRIVRTSGRGRFTI